MNSTMKTWREYFERNKVNRATIDWNRSTDIEPHLREPLIRSLQRFQVGESGGCGHLQKASEVTGDADYVAAIQLFAAEEGEHGRMLAKMLKNLDAPLLNGHWSDGLFIVLRRFGGPTLRGLHIELMTLLIAEMIAKRYYRALYEGSRDQTLRDMCAQILSDEMGHVAFHCDYLHRNLAHISPAKRASIRGVWRFFYRAATLLVLVDHRAVLGATGVSPREWWRSCNLVFDITAAQIFNTTPHHQLTTQTAR